MNRLLFPNCQFCFSNSFLVLPHSLPPLSLPVPSNPIVFVLTHQALFPLSYMFCSPFIFPVMLLHFFPLSPSTILSVASEEVLLHYIISLFLVDYLVVNIFRQTIITSPLLFPVTDATNMAFKCYKLPCMYQHFIAFEGKLS